MQKITFITWNQHKADYLAQFLGYPVDHIKLDLDEVQSTDLREIVEHKVKQAYSIVKKPVIVEDVSLEFEELGWLPGPFIKFFVDKVPFQNVCNMIWLNRNATAKCVFGYYDGKELHLFEWKLDGTITTQPSGENWYGRDQIFIPQWYDVTRASLSPEDDQKTYLQIKPFAQLKDFLERR